MANRLAEETSPYLLQHKDNPVDWYPWGQDAIERAQREQKPIFLSIGYSACHWCHVMEHESFESEEVATLLNEKFVSVKVDREERPDIDQIYMNVTQMMTGQGGWPMSVFLTPDMKPFYAGTYFPPHSRGGMPGFKDVLAAVDDAWRQRREHAEDMGNQVVDELQRIGAAGQPGRVSRESVDEAIAQTSRSFDWQWGGFGAAPKFPHPLQLQLLLRHWHRTGREASLDMVCTTLDRMAAGGIYDHVGGGFARYSVDERWLVPHFEKMLYDNAQLAATYVEAWQVTGNDRYAQVARETIDYVLRDMTDPAGGFYSAEDADSEGHEGLFYTWTPTELAAVLGSEEASTFARVYDVTEAGNFEGRSILNLPKTLEQAAQILGRDLDELRTELAVSRKKLFDARESRVHPGKDDKVLVAWNGLMIDALARAGAAMNEHRYIAAAEKAADFVLTELVRGSNSRLLHTWRRGQAKLDAYLDDYACLANALVSLYEATFEEQRLTQAARLADAVLEHFADREGGGFYYTADDHEKLIARTKDLTDASIPSASAMATMSLVRLGKLTGVARYLEAADAAIAAAAGHIKQIPMAMGQMLLAADLSIGPSHEMVFVGGEADADVLADIRRRFVPNKVMAGIIGPVAPQSPLVESLLAGKSPPEDGNPRLYVCEDFACQAPVEGRGAIEGKIAELGRDASA